MRQADERSPERKQLPGEDPAPPPLRGTADGVRYQVVVVKIISTFRRFKKGILLYDYCCILFLHFELVHKLTHYYI